MYSNTFAYRALLLSVLLSVAVHLSIAGEDTARTVRVGLFQNKPLSYLEEDGRAIGIYPEILQEIASEEGWTLEWVLDSWAGCLDRLDAGTLDLMISIVPSPERLERYDFTSQYAITAWGGVYRHPDSGLDSILDLDGKEVAVMTSDISSANFRTLCDKFGVEPVFTEFPTLVDVCNAIASKKVDVGVINSSNGNYLSRTYDIVSTPIVFEPLKAFFATPKGKNADLIAAIDRHLADWRHDKNSVYYTILNRWQGAEGGASPFPWHLLGWILGCALALVSISVLWNRMLAQQVRKQTSALRESEQEYRELLQNLHAGVVVHAPDTTIQFANEFASSYFGIPVDSLKGRTSSDPAWDFVHEDGTPMGHSEQPVSQVISKNAPVKELVVGIRSRETDDVFWVLVNAFPEYDTAGNLHQIVATFVDISDQRSMQARLRQSHAMLARTEALAHIGSWEWDVDDDRVRWSDELFSIFKRDPSLGPPSYADHISLYPPEDMECLRTAVERCVSEGTPYELNLRAIRPDGETRHCVARGRAEVYENGRVVRLAGSLQDVTAHRLAEECLRASEAALKEAQRVTHIGNWELDIKQNKAMWSEELFRIFEVGGDPAQARYEDFLAAIHPEDRQSTKDAYAKAVSSHEPSEVTYRLLMRDGRIKTVREKCQTEYAPDGTPLRSFGTVQDITDRKELEDRIRQAEKMDAIGRLAGGVAHDFNNQLAGMQGYAEMLSNRLEDPTLKRYAENIRVGATRSSDLTRKLLAFSRQGQYEAIPMSVHGLINEVVDILSHTIDKKIQIQRLLKATPDTVRGDASQTQNALLNLALNAADAMPDGGDLIFQTSVSDLTEEDCRALSSDIAPGRYLRLRVIDNGSGIAEEHRDRVFEPFFTTKEVGKGTGMGLAAVFGTVQHMRGTIEFDSESGKGTTFCLYLPVEEQAASNAKAHQAIRPAAREANILVIDDEALFRNFAGDLLHSLDYRVHLEPDGESGLAYFREHWQEIDLVILDMVMPRMDGPQAYRAMKEVNSRVKVLLASGYSLNGTAQELLAEGVNGFVQKPFDGSDLSAKVAQLLQGEQDP